MMLSKIRFSSVRAKITILIVLLSVFLCILTMLLLSFYVNFELNEKNISNINITATEQVHHTAQIIKTDQLFAKMLGTNSQVREFFLDPNKEKGKVLLDFFSEYTRENSKYLAIYLLDIQGIGLVSTDDRFVGQDYSFRDYFKKALSGRAYIDAAIGSTSHQFGYYYSYPVRGADGGVIGILVVKTNNTEIDESILRSHLLNTSTVMLTDNFGIILASNRSERYLKSVGTITPENATLIAQTNKLLGRAVVPLQYNEVQQVIDTYTEMTTINIYDAEDKENENISVIKFDDLPFFLVTETGMQRIGDTILSIVIRSGIIFLIGILLVSVLVYRIIMIFISPLSKFHSVSKAISSGDFSQRLDVGTEDEFGELAATMNSVAVNLGDTFTDLENRVQELKVPLVIINSVAKQFNDAREKIIQLIPDMSMGISLIVSESQKISQMVDSLLEEIESKNIRPTTVLDLVSVIRQMHAALMPVLTRGAISLHYDPPAALPVLVDSPMDIENAFLSILDNAIKYSKRGGEINISHETTEKYIKTIIVGTATAILKDDLLKINIPTSGPVGNKEGGVTRADLVSMKDVIEENGGMITVESIPVAGATVTVYLPVV